MWKFVKRFVDEFEPRKLFKFNTTLHKSVFLTAILKVMNYEAILTITSGSFGELGNNEFDYLNFISLLQPHRVRTMKHLLFRIIKQKRLIQTKFGLVLEQKFHEPNFSATVNST